MGRRQAGVRTTDVRPVSVIPGLENGKCRFPDISRICVASSRNLVKQAETVSLLLEER